MAGGAGIVYYERMIYFDPPVSELNSDQHVVTVNFIQIHGIPVRFQPLGFLVHHDHHGDPQSIGI